ncbi:MAG: hypothetical protein RBS99_15480 [Rhodospirillales bacterium]|jgi:hypothetical protein|nr:hypothetical protein [Rhodospirillales bacterium]
MSHEKTLSLTVIEALDTRIRAPITDRSVAKTEDLAPVAVADRTILQYGIGLDAEQREAMAKAAKYLDEARKAYGTLQARRPGRFVDQHLTEMSREATLMRVGDRLEAARQAAALASVELRITADQHWSSTIGDHFWRVVLKAIPAKTASRAAA